jgi:hypothetical protein
MTEPADLVTRAIELGRAHRAEDIRPYGPAEFVRWEEGGADLLRALGETEPTTFKNYYERSAAVGAYCDELYGNEGEA